mgnify:CR=1 FL=1
MHPEGHSSRKKSSAAQATEVTDADGKPDDAVEPMREQVGGHLRNGEQRNDQHDAHHAQHATMVSAMNIISAYSNTCTGMPCERANSRSKAT